MLIRTFCFQYELDHGRGQVAVCSEEQKKLVLKKVKSFSPANIEQV